MMSKQLEEKRATDNNSNIDLSEAFWNKSDTASDNKLITPTTIGPLNNNTVIDKKKPLSPNMFNDIHFDEYYDDDSKSILPFDDNDDSLSKNGYLDMAGWNEIFNIS